jgi:hypothetical protein
MPDRIHDTLLNKNVNYSYVPFTRGKQNIDRTMRAHIEQAYGKLPMRFEANEGQTDARVKFIARGEGPFDTPDITSPGAMILQVIAEETVHAHSCRHNNSSTCRKPSSSRQSDTF